MLDYKVLLDCVTRQMEEEVYGYSTGKVDDSYSGLSIRNTLSMFQRLLLGDQLIPRLYGLDVAREIIEKLKKPGNEKRG